MRRFTGAYLALAVCAACNATVQPYITSIDRAELLAPQAAVRFESTVDSTLPTIEVDPSQSYQTIVGFGAALTDASAWLIMHRLPEARRDSLLRELFRPYSFADTNSIGLSFLRIDMGASDFALRQYTYDDMPAGQRDSGVVHFSIAPDSAETLPILRRARALNPNLVIVASPWSAPAWMKTTRSLIKGTLRDDSYWSYALYFSRFIASYITAGVPIQAITMQNEPHFEPGDYPGMRLDPAQRIRLVKLMGPLLGSSTHIWEWDHNWDQPNEPLAVLADSTARRYVAAVAWHCYAGEVSAQSIVHDAHPDKDTYITECSGGEWAPNFGDNLDWMVENLIIGGTRNWARGVLLWNLVLDEQHGPHTGGCGNCRGVLTIKSDGTIVRNEEYYALAHASRFVPPGARRIGSTSPVEGLESVAFEHGSNDLVLYSLIVVNTNKTPKEFAVRFEGRAFRYLLPPGAVATFVF